MRSIRLLILIAGLLAIPAAAAHADIQTIDFETGPPLLTPVDRVGDVSFPRPPGLRPYRTDVGTRAHSGTVVGDVGRCFDEFSSGECGEGFFEAGTTALLARTARSVTLWAGELQTHDPTENPEQATLTAFRADGSVAGVSGPLTIGSASIGTRLSVTSAATDIASFGVFSDDDQGNGAPDLAIDDVTVDFGNTPGAADFSVSADTRIADVVQGQSVSVPIRISRINGSNGPISLSVSGLPPHVTATISPNPILGSNTTATITLKGDANLVDSNGRLSDVTVKADPLGNTGVGFAPRTTKFSVRLAALFGLSVDRQAIQAADCTPVDVGVVVPRGGATASTIDLALRDAVIPPSGKPATGPPPGVTADILPGTVVVPNDGGLNAQRTLRLTVDPAAEPDIRAGGSALLDLDATSRTTPPITHTVRLTVTRLPPTASIATTTPGSGFGYTPRFGKPGRHVEIHGSGFCPGTKIEVGNNHAIVTPDQIDAHTLAFDVPRYATTGPITIDPPGGLPSYTTTDALTVDSVRNIDGFPFYNYDFGRLSLGELASAYGLNEVFVNVNPCWPFGDCTISTGIPNPGAFAVYGILAAVFNGSNGHCFGMGRAVQQFVGGQEPITNFATVFHSTVYQLPGPARASTDLNHYLDGQHTLQASDEFLKAWFSREPDLNQQLDRIEAEFAHGRMPMISFQKGYEGHVVVAYDMVRSGFNADIYVYDPNQPFLPSEDTNGAAHQASVDGSVIHVNLQDGTWSFPPLGWGGRNDGTLFAVPQSTIPQDPNLPGASTALRGLSYLVFGSTDDSVRTAGASSGAQYLPPLDSHATPGANGWWINNGRTPIDAKFTGVRTGRYSEAFADAGFTAAARDVPTSRGVRDTITGSGSTMTFAGSAGRPLTLELAQHSAAMDVGATLATHTSANGSDRAGLAPGGTVAFTHDGAATAVRLSLTTIRRNGGPATFASGPIAVADGDHVVATPDGRSLAHVRLRIRDAHGHTTTRTLRNRAHRAGRVAISAARVVHRRVIVRVRLSGAAGAAVVGTTLRLIRGRHTVALRASSVRTANDTRTIGWALPRRVKAGRYRLMTDVRALIATGPATIVAHRAATVRVAR